jgi:hypothetical protein
MQCSLTGGFPSFHDPSGRRLTSGKQNLNNIRAIHLQRIQLFRRLLWEVMVMRTVSVVVATACLLVACGNNTGTDTGNDTGTGETPSMTPSPTSSSSTPAGGPVEQAKADLAKRLSIDAARVTVVSSEEVTWSDGSLGCPEPGMMYTQALVPGGRIILEVDGTQYNYHSGANRAPFLCEHPK